MGERHHSAPASRVGYRLRMPTRLHDRGGQAARVGYRSRLGERLINRCEPVAGLPELRDRAERVHDVGAGAGEPGR